MTMLMSQPQRAYRRPKFSPRAAEPRIQFEKLAPQQPVSRTSEDIVAFAKVGDLGDATWLLLDSYVARRDALVARQLLGETLTLRERMWLALVDRALRIGVADVEELPPDVARAMKEIKTRRRRRK